MSSAKIIPFASGKGGTGKSLLTTNLGIALAEQGHTVTIVDLDLGGSNVHTFLGMPNDFPGLGDFLIARRTRLQDLVVETGIPNLSYVPGDFRTPFMANIHHAHKMKLIRHLKNLPSKYVLLDLGAGSSYNVIDFYSMVDRGIVISTPEYPSIMNMLGFLKNFVFRNIERSIKRYNFAHERFKKLHKEALSDENITVNDLIDQIGETSEEAGRLAREVCDGFKPRLLFNMVDAVDEFKFLEKIEANINQKLSLKMEHLGFIPRSKVIQESVRDRKVLMTSFSGKPIAELILILAKRMDDIWDFDVNNSMDFIRNDAEYLLSLKQRAEPQQT